MAANIRYYVDDDAAAHQSHFEASASAGYHPISVSVYGSPSTARYATVWVQETWSTWKAIHGVNSAQYQTWFDQVTSPSQAFVPTLITAVGPPGGAVFASVVERLGAIAWQQRCEMTGQQFSDNNATFYNSRLILKSVSEYGTIADRRYCAIWHGNPNNDKYWWDKSLTYADYQTFFNSQTTKPYWRPSYLSVSGDQRITALFVDTDVGQWQSAHGMDKAAFTTKHNSMTSAGLTLTHLQGGGTGSNARFAALWSKWFVQVIVSGEPTG